MNSQRKNQILKTAACITALAIFASTFSTAIKLFGDYTGDYAQQALRDTASSVGWPTTPYEVQEFNGVGIAAREVYGVSPTGTSEAESKAIVAIGTSPNSFIDMLFENGIPKTTFHGHNAAVIKGGDKICNAGGIVGFWLKFVRWIVVEIGNAMGKQVNPDDICFNASGIVAWECEDRLFITNAPEKSDNSMIVAETLYSNAKKQKLCEDAGSKADWNTIKDKLSKDQPLTTCELLYYIEKVEGANPGRNWEDIVARIHYQAYPGDNDISIAGYPLYAKNDYTKFININIFDKEVNNSNSRMKVPRFITLKNGDKVDVGHTYAGVRAGIGRGWTNSAAGTTLSTDAGDIYQIFFDEKGVVSGVKQILTLDPVGGAKTIWHSPDYWPADQRRGNSLAWTLRGYFRDHPDAKLSDGFREYFLLNGEDTCGGTPKPLSGPQPTTPPISDGTPRL
ncbi:Uncharacterised protein [uncultured archaeon]|nr:Uncharacterised protein [uncultured archaeon]